MTVFSGIVLGMSS